MFLTRRTKRTRSNTVLARMRHESVELLFQQTDELGSGAKVILLISRQQSAHSLALADAAGGRNDQRIGAGSYRNGPEGSAVARLDCR